MIPVLVTILVTFVLVVFVSMCLNDCTRYPIYYETFGSASVTAQVALHNNNFDSIGMSVNSTSFQATKRWESIKVYGKTERKLIPIEFHKVSQP